MAADRAKTIYLDHSASAPLVAAARQAISALLSAGVANPSSIHLPGQLARRVVDDAREAVAALVGARPDEVVFTSGATEANFLAWRGVLAALPAAAGQAGRASKGRAATCRAEHPSTLAAAKLAASHGWQIDWLEVDGQGQLDLAEVAAALSRPTSRLLSLMAVNNETGLRHPTQELAVLARRHGLVHHCDATQAVGRQVVDVAAWGVDLLSLSGHKLGAPAGVGALIVRRGTTFKPPLEGHQEQGVRPGSENLLGIAALAAAAAAAPERIARSDAIRALRDRAWSGIEASIDGVQRHGAVPAADESGHILNIGFDGVPGDLLAMALDLEEIAVSTGSACSSGTLAPSHVLLAMAGEDPARRRSCAEAIRLGLGPETHAEEIKRLLGVLPVLVERIRRRLC